MKKRTLLIGILFIAFSSCSQHITFTSLIDAINETSDNKEFQYYLTDKGFSITEYDDPAPGFEYWAYGYNRETKTAEIWIEKSIKYPLICIKTNGHRLHKSILRKVKHKCKHKEIETSLYRRYSKRIYTYDENISFEVYSLDDLDNIVIIRSFYL